MHKLGSSNQEYMGTDLNAHQSPRACLGTELQRHRSWTQILGCPFDTWGVMHCHWRSMTYGSGMFLTHCSKQLGPIAASAVQHAYMPTASYSSLGMFH